jgi:hypothetical protein
VRQLRSNRKEKKMASLLDSVRQLMTSDMVGTIGKSLGVDTSMVQRGLDVAGPLLQSGLANRSQTSAGLDGIMGMLPKDGGASLLGSLGNLAGMLGKGGLLGSVASSGLLSGIFGSGTSAIGKTLSDRFGFSATPLLGLAASALLGQLAKTAQDQKLTSGGIARMLQNEASNTQGKLKPEVQTVLNEALDAGKQAETLKQAFTDAEWTKVRLAPLAAVSYVMKSSPSGLVGRVKELTAAGDAMTTALKDVGPTSLLNVAFGNIGPSLESDPQVEEKSRGDVLNLLKDAAAAVRAKAPKEASSFGKTLVVVATKVAEATKEGGFLGMGGALVSPEEQVALDEIKSAVASRQAAASEKG